MTQSTSMLLTWDTVKPWQQDNEYILGHYRPASGNYWKSFLSLRYSHNQTANFYTHFLGALGFGAAALYQYNHSPRSLQWSSEDRVLLAFFFVGAILCLLSSAYFHLIGNHSHEVYNRYLTLDFFGIVVLTLGTAFPLAYYTYPCYTRTLQLLLTTVQLLLY